ncbi:MAG: flagellar hook capping FlgD N-terminal domain-containing protein [Mangrovicoccus sp.]
MEISSLPQTNGAAGLSAATETTENSGVISSDFETFLVMLTAQIQNQDPLNPMDSSDYAVQLATFSGVEQQVQTNELLRELGAGSSRDLMEIAGWVGLEARVESGGYFDGEEVTLNFDPHSELYEGYIVVRDPDGSQVARLDIDAGQSEVAWNGDTTTGGKAEAGSYSFYLYTKEGYNSELAISQVRSYAKIVEVRSSTDGPEIVLANGDVLPSSDVTALRNPKE